MRLFSRRRHMLVQTLPVLQTERLVLRCFDLNDAVDVFAYAQNPSVGLMAGWQPHQSVEDSRQWIEKILLLGNTWAVVEKRTGRVIGTISLNSDRFRRVENALEMGYALGQDYWGHGYATEACREVMRYAFNDLACPILSVSHFPQNSNSRRVIKKLGFVHEGVLRSAFTMPDGSCSDLLVYSMTAQEYSALSVK